MGWVLEVGIWVVGYVIGKERANDEPAKHASQAEQSNEATAAEWMQPNGNYENTRIANSEIAADNVEELAIAWTQTLTGAGPYGSFAPHRSSARTASHTCRISAQT